LNSTTPSRREFLRGAGGGLGGAWLAANWPGIAAAHEHAAAAANPHAAHGTDAAAHGTEPDTAAGEPALGFFDAAEARTVDAIAAHIVPTDDLPGAREAGALYFIDRSLATWAAEGSAAFRRGLAEFHAAYAALHPGADFAAADADAQIAYLVEVDRTAFFQSLRFLTLLGMFSLPGYGGNRGGLGWRILGFEDTHAFYPPFGFYDRDYPGFVAATNAGVSPAGA
jgi:gluconate 2-dehydrogenase gamma chain